MTTVPVVATTDLICPLSWSPVAHQRAKCYGDGCELRPAEITSRPAAVPPGIAAAGGGGRPAGRAAARVTRA